MNQMKRMPVLLLSFLVMLANLGVPMAQAGTTNQASPLYAIEMPGSSSGYLEVTHNTSFDYNGGAITIEAWVKYNASSGAMTIAGNGQNSSFWLGLTASGYLSFTPGGTSRLVNSTHAITSGRWTHVAVVYISNGYRAYYINGALDSMVTSGNPALANGSITHSLFIGYDPDASGYYSGVMDELRIWKAARAPTQIADDLFTSLSGATTDVAAEWSFDGNANDSTGVNNATSHGTSLSYVMVLPSMGIAIRLTSTPWPPCLEWEMRCFTCNTPLQTCGFACTMYPIPSPPAKCTWIHNIPGLIPARRNISA